MKAKKELLERARKEGAFDEVKTLISAYHLLICEANDLLEESSDILQRYGLAIGIIKKLHNDFTKCADRYFNEVSKMIPDNDSKMNMFTDIQEFNEHFRKWSGLKK